MIGKYARGFRHLKRIVGSSKTKRIFILQGGRILDAEAFLYRNNGKETLFVFQHLGGNNDTYKIPAEHRYLAENLLSRYPYFYIVKDYHTMMQLGRKYFIADDNFNEQYEQFQKSNKKLLEQVYGKCCYATDPMAMFMYALNGGAPNLYVWAISNYYKNNVSICLIEHIIFFSKKYAQLVGKLSKGSITSYNSKENIHKLYAEIVQLRAKKRANDSINSFNTAQKKLLKQIELNDKNVHILNRFGRLSGVKRQNFIRKMSTIDNTDEIMKQMSLLSNIHFDWNKESLLEFINNCEQVKCDVVLDENNIVLVKVNSYDTVKLLAKTTNWCISKNKRYWNDYVGFKSDATQFVLFDFNKPEDHELSIIGFTTRKNNGIVAAHDYTNSNLMGSAIQRRTRLSSFLTNICPNNIYSIIKEHKISLPKIMNMSMSRYEWNLHSFMSFLNYCMNEDDYTIHYMEDEQLVISTKNENVRFIVNNDTFKNTYDMQGKPEVFLFMDFEMGEDESERLRYSFININNRTQEESANGVFDIYGGILDDTFDSVLEEFGLPYDTICRTNDSVKRFENAFRNFDVVTVNNMIKDKSIVEAIKSDNRRSFYQISGGSLYETIFGHRSFDYINAIYDNGYRLIDFVDRKSLDDILTSLVYEVSSQYRNLGRLPNEDDIKHLYDNNRFNQRQKLLIGFYIILCKMFENETHKDFGNKLSEIFPNLNHYYDLDLFLLKFLLPKMQFKKLGCENEYILKQTAKLNNEELNKIILGKSICKTCGKYFLNCLHKSSPLYDEFFNKYGDKTKPKEDNVEVNENSNTVTYSFSF